MFDTAQYKSLSFLVSSKLKEPGQILKGLYGMILNFDPLYVHRELQFRANVLDEGISFWSFWILYKNMTS